MGTYVFEGGNDANEVVLDGGLKKWLKEKKPITNKKTTFKKGNFSEQ